MTLTHSRCLENEYLFFPNEKLRIFKSNWKCLKINGICNLKNDNKRVNITIILTLLIKGNNARKLIW